MQYFEKNGTYLKIFLIADSAFKQKMRDYSTLKSRPLNNYDKYSTQFDFLGVSS